MQDYEDFRKIVEDQLRQVEMASRRLEISFVEFQGLFSLMLRSSFIDQAAKELLRESFMRLEDRMKDELSNNENSYTNLKNWFSFYLGTPLSETDDWSTDELKTSNSQ